MVAQTSFLEALEERSRILEMLMRSPDSRVYLTALRSFGREVCYRKGEVHIDDVRALIKERDFPMPKDLKLKGGERIFGTVFATKEFEPVKQIVSTRKERVARSGRGSSLITVYRLKESA